MSRADVDAGGFQSDVNPMCAIIALGRRVSVGVDVQSIVGAGLHTSLTANAASIVKIDNAVLSSEQCRNWADFDTRGVIAMVAAHDRKKPSRLWEFSLLNVLDPRSIDSDCDFMFALTSDRASVTTDTATVVDYKTVICHGN